MSRHDKLEKPEPIKMLDKIGDGIREGGRGFIKFNQKLIKKIFSPGKSFFETVTGDIDDKTTKFQEDLELGISLPREAIHDSSRDITNAVLAPIPIYKYMMEDVQKECGGCPPEEIRTKTIQKVSDLGLDAANIFWPGTAAPDAKAKVSKQVGKPLSRLTGLDIIPPNIGK